MRADKRRGTPLLALLPFCPSCEKIWGALSLGIAPCDSPEAAAERYFKISA